MSEHLQPVTNEINITIIGDDGTGKTSIINSYALDTFQQEYIPSTLNQFRIECNISNKDYKKHFPTVILNIKDLGGKAEHKSMRQLSFKSSDFIILTYSLSDSGKSLANLQYWIEEELGEYGPNKKEKAIFADNSLDKSNILNDSLGENSFFSKASALRKDS